MVLLDKILCQDSAVKYLRNSLSSGRLANGLLFTGSDGVGKALTAAAFLAELLCLNMNDRAESGACGGCASCRALDSGAHPDLMWINPDEGKKTVIAEVRAARDRISMKPYVSRYNVCVIEKAHMMTPESSNAILKILEEPPGNSLFILITDKKELLLPTVVSRCTEVKFGPVPAKTVAAILAKETGMMPEKALSIALRSGGSPGRAIKIAESDIEQRREEVLALLDELNDSGNGTFAVWDEVSKEGLVEDLEYLISLLRDSAIEKAGVKSEAPESFKGYTSDKLYETVGKLVRFKRDIQGNINPKLVAQNLPGSLLG